MEEDYFGARVKDTFEISDRTNVPKFLGFLTQEEVTRAECVLRGLKAHYSFYGGYECANRVFLACMPDWCESPEFPIDTLLFKYRICDKLSHRDFLGSLMAIGITRECVGDILVGEGYSVVFVYKEITKHICTQIIKIGNVGVNVTVGYNGELPLACKMTDCSCTIASMRADCVIAAITNTSRSNSVKLIEDGLVSIDHVCCTKPTKCIDSTAEITIRGKGKFNITDISQLTKKGRIVLKYKKYI